MRQLLPWDNVSMGKWDQDSNMSSHIWHAGPGAKIKWKVSGMNTWTMKCDRCGDMSAMLSEIVSQVCCNVIIGLDDTNCKKDATIDWYYTCLSRGWGRLEVLHLEEERQLLQVRLQYFLPSFGVLSDWIWRTPWNPWYPPLSFPNHLQFCICPRIVSWSFQMNSVLSIFSSNPTFTIVRDRLNMVWPKKWEWNGNDWIKSKSDQKQNGRWVHLIWSSWD